MNEGRIDATSSSDVSIHQITLSDASNNQLSDGARDFTSVNLASESKPKQKRLVLKDPSAPEFENKKNKTPKRVLHFSDGTLEEYSETEDEDEVDNMPPVNPKTLKWRPWFWHYMTKSAKGTLSTADFLGEKLAWFLGITSPKYQSAIDEFNRVKKQEEEDKENEEKEREFQRQRRLQGSGLDIEGGVSTYSNKAFGSESTGNDTELKQTTGSDNQNTQQLSHGAVTEDKF